jgi:tetratricopeptide (TPR) repeat protein
MKSAPSLGLAMGMNVKSVTYWLSENWVSTVSPMIAFVAILAGIPFLSGPFFLWLGLSFVWVFACFFSPLRIYVAPARHYYQAGKLAENRRFRESLALVTRFLRRHPRDGHAYGLKALALAGLGRTGEALAEAARAVSLKRHGQTLMVRGQILSWLGCHVEALSDLEASHRLRENTWTRFLMGTQYAALRQLDTALAIFSRSTRSLKNSMTYLCLADCLRLLARMEEAAAPYRKAEEKARREVKSGRPSESNLAYSLAQLSQGPGSN